MPSSPTVPADCPVDLDHLKRMTLGEEKLEREVLELFLAQTSRLLDAQTSDAGAMAHTLKGSARAIGAFRVGDSAALLEAAIRQGGDPSPALTALKATVAEARAAIEARLGRT